VFNQERPIRRSTFIYPKQLDFLKAIAATRGKKLRSVFLDAIDLYINHFLRRKV
jgi:hypothetical protein